MRPLRGVLSWLFALWGSVCLLVAGMAVRALMLHPLHGQSHDVVVRRLIILGAFSILATICLTAWWTTLRKRPSAKGWGLAASLSLVVIAFFPYFGFMFGWHFRPGTQRPLVTSLCAGILGVIAYWRYEVKAEAAAQAAKPAPIPGDGTSKFGNVLFGAMSIAASYGIYIWWFRWRHLKGIHALNAGPLGGLLWLMLIGLAVAFVHELGHALAGKAAGMKLRAFIVGPIQFVCEQGRWKLKINLKKIFSSGGATGLVPTTADFPAASYVRMLVAGPLVNLATGAAALWAAFVLPSGARVQEGGLLALFAAFSLLAGVGNLLPFGTPSGYSDGAKIYQLSKGGPWGDFYRAISFAGAAVVTPLRPRNYDIATIEKAAAGIAQGREGLLLRLFAYTCYLDRSEVDQAGFWLKQAAQVYEESASAAPAQILTVFVFGYACMLRDAAEARKWWQRMEQKKPTRLNVDYWRAKSALCWIEGNLKEASEAWDKAADAALKLPAAGAYEFDRDLCGLLLYEIDRSSAGQQPAPVAVAAMQ